MKCVSCETEINPQWAHAIDSNICPFCGRSILEEHLKKLLSTLRETMEQLQGYSTQLDDWMLSNHNYIKTDSEKIVDYIPKELLDVLKKANDDREFQDRKKFTVKVQTENGEEEVSAEKLQSEKKTNDFFKRAEVIRAPSNQQPSPNATPSFQSPGEKTEYLKKVVQQIKKTGSPLLTDSTGSSMNLPAEMLEQADPEAVAEFQQLISGGEGISSSLPDSMDDEVPPGILAANIAAAARAKGGGASNSADLMKLQQMQDRVSRSTQNFESGANRGKGGFSRTS